MKTIKNNEKFFKVLKNVKMGSIEFIEKFWKF